MIEIIKQKDLPSDIRSAEDFLEYSELNNIHYHNPVSVSSFGLFVLDTQMHFNDGYALELVNPAITGDIYGSGMLKNLEDGFFNYTEGGIVTLVFNILQFDLIRTKKIFERLIRISDGSDNTITLHLRNK